MIKTIVFLSLSLVVASGASAGWLIESGWRQDIYQGADDHNYGDRIGNNIFEVGYSKVALADTYIEVTVATNFALDGAVSGARFGDLFFTFDGYTPFGTGPEYLQDNFDAPSTTVWKYGLDLQNVDVSSNNVTVANSGSAVLYDLSTATSYADVIGTSTEVWNSGGTIRDGQEVKVMSGADGLESVALNSGSWDRTGVANIPGDPNPRNGWGNSWRTLTMRMDLNVEQEFGISDQADFNFAYKWGMTCANDTTEIAINYTVPPNLEVPEPTSLAIFGFGVLGLGFAQRRRKNKVA